MRNRRRLGHPITLAYQNVSQGREAAGKSGGKRSGSGFHPAQTMLSRKLTLLGGLTQCIQGRRHGGHHGDALIYDQGNQLRYMEAGYEDECPAQSQHWVQNHVQTVDVIEREKAKNHIIRSQGRTVRRDELKNIRDQIEMREHHALRKSGGAAGIGKCGQRFL